MLLKLRHHASFLLSLCLKGLGTPDCPIVLECSELELVCVSDSVSVCVCVCVCAPALEEAKDICTYLRPLQRLFEDLENVEFPEVKGQIGPLMHVVCLVWSNSRYYNTPARLIVLLQETCNLLIQQVHEYTVNHVIVVVVITL